MNADALKPEIKAIAPKGNRRMGANPHANGGILTVALDIPSFTDYAVKLEQPGSVEVESTRPFGKMLRDIFTRNAKQHNFRLFCPDETNSNRLGDVFDVENRCLVSRVESYDDHVAHDGRVMEVLSEHCHQGWLEGYTLTGRHGVFASYEAFAMIVDSMATQHAKWLQTCQTELPWRHPVPSLELPAHFDLLAQRSQRLQPSGSRLHRHAADQARHRVANLPAARRELPAVGRRPLSAQPRLHQPDRDRQAEHPVWLDIDAAREHCSRGASVWKWAGNEGDDEPDLVLACAGDVMTEEAIAAAWLFRKYLPEMKIRVVNVVDLMTLFPPDRHPHGMSEDYFLELFTRDKDVIFAFHGYPGEVHQLLHGRPNPDRFHVRGYVEEGTTTTPFDMLVLNQASRYHLCIEGLRRAPRYQERARELIKMTEAALDAHRKYIVEHLEDMPAIRNWKWTPD